MHQQLLMNLQIAFRSDKMCSHTGIISLPFSALTLIMFVSKPCGSRVRKCVIKPAAHSVCQHAGVRKDVTRRQLVLMNLQIACQAKCVVTVVALAWLFLHDAHFITSVFWPGGTGRSYQHNKGQKRSDPGDCLQPIRFLPMCEQARCKASLPRTVRYEFCRMKCTSWGQMQRLAD